MTGFSLNWPFIALSVGLISCASPAKPTSPPSPSPLASSPSARTTAPPDDPPDPAPPVGAKIPVLLVREGDVFRALGCYDSMPIGLVDQTRCGRSIPSGAHVRLETGAVVQVTEKRAVGRCRAPGEEDDAFVIPQAGSARLAVWPVSWKPRVQAPQRDRDATAAERARIQSALENNEITSAAHVMHAHFWGIADAAVDAELFSVVAAGHARTIYVLAFDLGHGESQYQSLSSLEVLGTFDFLGKGESMLLTQSNGDDGTSHTTAMPFQSRLGRVQAEGAISLDCP